MPTLVEHFLDKYNKQNGRKIKTVMQETWDMLNAYRWPGNVRELENVIERSVVLSEREAKVLTPDLMPLPIQSAYEQRQTP